MTRDDFNLVLDFDNFLNLLIKNDDALDKMYDLLTEDDDLETVDCIAKRINAMEEEIFKLKFGYDKDDYDQFYDRMCVEKGYVENDGRTRGDFICEFMADKGLG